MIDPRVVCAALDDGIKRLQINSISRVEQKRAAERAGFFARLAGTLPLKFFIDDIDE